MKINITKDNLSWVMAQTEKSIEKCFDIYHRYLNGEPAFIIVDGYCYIASSVRMSGDIMIFTYKDVIDINSMAEYWIAQTKKSQP